MINEKGNISIQTENIFPIIKSGCILRKTYFSGNWFPMLPTQ